MKMPFKKLEPYTNWEGKRYWADAGVSKGDKKPMFKCECGGYVVWVKSSKTGKNYLANCSRYGNGDSDYVKYWYAAHSAHFQTCEETMLQKKKNQEEETK